MRLVGRLTAAFFLAASLLLASGADLSIYFSKMPAGEPKGFRSALTGKGAPGEWKILEAEGPTGLPTVTSKAAVPKQNVLAQVSRDATDARHPLLIMEEGDYDDFTLTTRFKLVAGVVEQMAGVAFRIKDENNYYYVRASGLYNTIALVPVLNGVLLAPKRVEVPIEKGVWHELKIKAAGNQFTVWFNGRQVIDAQGELFGAGKIGFWTKSDSVSYFADTHLDYRPRETLAQTLMKESLKKYDKVLAMRVIGKKGETVAASRPEEVGRPATEVELDVLKNSKKYFGRDKGKKFIIVTLPLNDRNGETIAAVRIEMDTFKGQTEENAIARAMPIVKEMEMRVARAPDVTGF